MYIRDSSKIDSRLKIYGTGRGVSISMAIDLYFIKLLPSHICEFAVVLIE